MEKAIFTITCTTCHARLAVRSEAAIGTILECPKCESMVHVTPPEGWVSPRQSIEQESGDGSTPPPPLDRVAEAPLTVELEPSSFSLFRNMWAIWAAAILVAVLILWGLWSVLPSSSSEESAKQPEPEAAQPVAPSDEEPTPPEAVPEPETVEPEPAKESPPSEVPEETPPVEPPPVEESPAPPLDPVPAPVAPEPPLFPAPDGATNAIPPEELKKLPPPEIDIAARLADPIKGLDLRDVSLIGVLDLLTEMSTVPITLDADAITRLGISPRDKISLRLDATTIGEALRAAAAEKKLEVVIDGSTAIVTAPTNNIEKQRKISYTVSDLAENKEELDKLAELVRMFVAPSSWSVNGGEGTITPNIDLLEVVQTEGVHRQLLVFCEKLRKARRLPLRSREDPKLFELDSRSQKFQKTLDRPVTANFHEPTPLSKILVYLGNESKIDILVDRAALAIARTSDGVDASVTADNRKLGETLDALLRPLGLSYRVVDDSLIQVTTPEALAERLELEFHPADKWLKKGVSVERLIEELKNRVAPATWSDQGGDAEIYYDTPSGYLIVLQSRPNQAEIERLLALPK